MKENFTVMLLQASDMLCSGKVSKWIIKEAEALLKLFNKTVTENGGKGLTKKAAEKHESFFNAIYSHDLNDDEMCLIRILYKLYIQVFSYGHFPKENIAILSKFLKDKNTIEVFAGNGYFSKQIHRKNKYSRCVYHGVDNRKTYLHASSDIHHDLTNIYYMSVLSTRINYSEYDVVVMVWPPSNTTPLKILDKMQSGQILIYLGEWDGCTANPAFHSQLESSWNANDPALMELERSLNANHVNKGIVQDNWYVFRKE